MIEKSKEANDMIAVERYKFISDKIKYLDNQFHVNISYVIKLTSVLTGFLIAAYMAFLEGVITEPTMLFSIGAVGILFMVISLFLILLSISSLFSWKDYREEEVELLNKIDCDLGREAPSFSGFLRWHETHFIILLVLFFICGAIITNNPSILFSMVEK